MRLSSSFTFALVAIVSCCLGSSICNAQLSEEMATMFEQMMDELDQDLQQKLQDAIENDQNIIRFTPDEFRRFRDNPVNPFDGIQDIDPDGLDGDIELKFELPSLRNRDILLHERQNQEMLEAFEPLLDGHQQSIVEVWADGKKVALGVVVDTNGSILTKNSEIADAEEVQVILHDRTTTGAKVTRRDRVNDLAIIRIESRELQPIRFHNAQPRTGAFVVTPGSTGNVLAIGTYSTTPRALAGQKQGFLGVKPQTATNGVLLVEVTPDEPGQRAGLITGDVVTSIAGRPTRDVTELVNEIRNHQPGDRVEIQFQRNGQQQRTTATLADRNFSGERAARFKMMNRLGAIPSSRSGSFPWVFQHDTPLFPEQCGGPILDLDGNVIGMNIARGGRAASYAIPTSHLQKILPELLRPNVASR